MSGTKKDGRLRLVPLMFTASGSPRPGRDVDLLLSWAARDQARLYIKVPEHDIAFADPNYSRVLPPSGAEMRLVTVNSTELANYFSKPKKGPVHGSDSPVTTIHGAVHPEITHLQLGAWHAESLKAKRHAMLDIFTSALMPHPRSHFTKDGWLAPCPITSALRLCSTDRLINEIVTSSLGTTASIHRELSNSPDRVEPKNIFIDALVAGKLDAQHMKHKADPYRLRRDAYGVYLLYRAADNYYDLLDSGQLDLKVVKTWIAKEAPVLYKKTITQHAVKLISPEHRRGSGIPESKQIKVDPEVLASDDYKPAGKRPSFVTEGLALLIFVALWWTAECHEVAEGRRARKPSRGDVHAKLQQAAFYPTERDALARVVMWPDQ